MAHDVDDPRIVVADISPGPFAFVQSVTVDGKAYGKDELAAAQIALLINVARRLEAIERRLNMQDGEG
jgi:hypothetical protein